MIFLLFTKHGRVLREFFVIIEKMECVFWMTFLLSGQPPMFSKQQVSHSAQDLEASRDHCSSSACLLQGLPASRGIGQVCYRRIGHLCYMFSCIGPSWTSVTDLKKLPNQSITFFNYNDKFTFWWNKCTYFWQVKKFAFIFLNEPCRALHLWSANHGCNTRLLQNLRIAVRTSDTGR